MSNYLVTNYTELSRYVLTMSTSFLVIFLLIPFPNFPCGYGNYSDLGFFGRHLGMPCARAEIIFYVGFYL